MCEPILIKGDYIFIQDNKNFLAAGAMTILTSVMQFAMLPLIYIMPHVVSNPTTGVYMAVPIADIIAVLFTSVLFSFQFKKALAEIQNENN